MSQIFQNYFDKNEIIYSETKEAEKKLKIYFYRFFIKNKKFVNFMIFNNIYNY